MTELHIVKSETAASLPIIIVGTGPVGIRLAEELVARGCMRPIVMFGDEPWEPYDRIRLSSLLAGEADLSELQARPRFGDTSVSCHHNCPIVSIDTERQQVIDGQGRGHRYSQLVLAVGSQPFRPSIPGVDAQRVYTFRDLNDTQALMARSAGSRRVVVIGGGLLGLETARAMQRAGTEVTVIQQADRLMNRQLDHEAAAQLRDNIKAKAIQVRLGEGVREILVEDQGTQRPRVAGVRLRNGDELACDTVILSAGIRPNVDLARDADIAVAKGIVVDHTLKTSAPNVYAVGECIEFNGQLFGLVAPGYEQAAVLAARLCGEEAFYTGSISATELKVVGLPVFSIGELEEDRKRSWRFATWIYRDRERGIYRKLIFRQGRLTAAIAIGEWPEVKRVQEAVSAQRRINPMQWLRFVGSGNLWSSDGGSDVARWPASAVVCNCRGLTRGYLSDTLAECDGKVELIARTGASSVCGSCSPLVAELCGESAPRPPLQSGLLVAAVMALILAIAIPLGSPVPYAQSVQESLHQLALLWSDGLYKQISGFSLLGLTVVGLYLSLNKRVKKLSFGKFTFWRLLHTVLGLLCLMILLAHTGLRMGENLNAYLMANFLALAGLGAVTAMVIAGETSLGAMMGKRLRRWCSWGHIVLFWPLPTLLAFHVISVYYF